MTVKALEPEVLVPHHGSERDGLKAQGEAGWTGWELLGVYRIKGGDAVPVISCCVAEPSKP
jgi:hypothetical protein